MKTYTITKAHIKNGEYIGARSEFDGHVLIEGGLGLVRFDSLSAKGSIITGGRTGIEANAISAGRYITTALGVTVGVTKA